MRKILFIMLLTALSSLKSFAQLSIGGTPPSISDSLLAAPIYGIDSLDNDSLALEMPVVYDSTGNNIYTTVMPRNYFGISIPIDLEMSTSGIWDTLTDGRTVWRLSFTSPTSIETSLSLSSVHLAPGAELFFYDANHRQIGGAFTDESNQPDSIFIAPFLLGNSITIEYVHPVGAIPIPNFIVKSIIHSFKSTRADNPECHNNVVCDPFQDYCNQIRSVCRIRMGHTYTWSNCNTTNVKEVWQTASAIIRPTILRPTFLQPNT